MMKSKLTPCTEDQLEKHFISKLPFKMSFVEDGACRLLVGTEDDVFLFLGFMKLLSNLVSSLG